MSGILSAYFNYDIEAGSSMADTANQMWKLTHPLETVNFLYRNNVIYSIIMGRPNYIILNARNKSFGDYTNKNISDEQSYLCSSYNISCGIW